MAGTQEWQASKKGEGLAQTGTQQRLAQTEGRRGKCRLGVHPHVCQREVDFAQKSFDRNRLRGGAKMRGRSPTERRSLSRWVRKATTEAFDMKGNDK